MGDRGNPFAHYNSEVGVQNQVKNVTSPPQLPQLPPQSLQVPRHNMGGYYPSQPNNMIGNKLEELQKMMGSIGSMLYTRTENLDKKIDELNICLESIKESVAANNNLQTAITVAVLGEGFKESKVLTEECKKMRESIHSITEHIKKEGEDDGEEE